MTQEPESTTIRNPKRGGQTVEPLTLPNDPTEALAVILAKYRIINPNRPEEGVEELDRLLSAGRNIELPQTIVREGDQAPFRLYPMVCYNIINACVKVLEKSLEKELQGDIPEGPEAVRLEALMCLADQLFVGACTSPDGRFTLHWVRKANPNDKKNTGAAIVLNQHGRRLKQLANRLRKYRTARIETSKVQNRDLDLPQLSCQSEIAREIKISLSRWGSIDPARWDGKRPWEMIDSLESYRERGNLPETSPSYQGEGLLYDEDRPDRQVNQEDWLQFPGLSDTLSIRPNIVKGNILSEDPGSWIWDYEEKPLQYIIDYLCSNAKSCLEEAHLQITKSLNNPSYAGIGSLGLLIDPKSKTSPDNFWKIIKRTASQFYSSREEETQATLRKLDCARFTLCLDATNQKFGIDPETFRLAFYEKIHSLREDPKLRDSKTRSEALLETLKESPEVQKLGWGRREFDQWLETLQSSGAHENSKAMEEERAMLLTRLNYIFQVLRSGLEKAGKDPTSNTEVVFELQKRIEDSSGAFYTYLSGKTGQTTRRELRVKIGALKKSAIDSGNLEVASKMDEMARFVSSVSGQIKSGSWYEKEKENKAMIFDLLLAILQLPKQTKLEFPGSPPPKPKDPLDISLDFIRGYANETLPSGTTTIMDMVETLREYESQEAGGQLSQAITKISKGQGYRHGRVQSLTDEISDRKATLSAAIEISKIVHESENPIGTLNELVNQELQVLRIPQSLNEEQNKLFVKNLFFWKGMHYLAQNIQSRKEPDKFQISSTGRGTLQNLIAISKAKIRNKEITNKDGTPLKQFILKKTRERTLGPNITVPMALWLKAKEKGTKHKISHEELIASLEEKLNACQVCLEACVTDSEIEVKTKEFEEKARVGKAHVNALALSECLAMLDDPAALSEGIEWERENPSQAQKLSKAHPELDTPNKRIAFIGQNAKSPEKEELAPSMH